VAPRLHPPRGPGLHLEFAPAAVPSGNPASGNRLAACSAGRGIDRVGLATPPAASSSSAPQRPPGRRAPGAGPPGPSPSRGARRGRGTGSKPVPVDLADLATALEDHSGPADHLCLRSGEAGRVAHRRAIRRVTEALSAHHCDSGTHLARVLDGDAPGPSPRPTVPGAGSSALTRAPAGRRRTTPSGSRPDGAPRRAAAG
jgi:hypothetical protein